MTDNPIDVSDKAIVAYLEFVAGADIEGLRRRIAKRAASAVKHQAGAVRLNGLRFLVKGATVTNIAETRAHRLRRRRIRR